MKILVIFLFGVNLIYCVELNGLISPPASNSHYSTGYGIGGENKGISSAIKFAEANSNVNSIARGLPATHNIENLAPSISTSGNVGIISASAGSPSINNGASTIQQLPERQPIPVPQPYPVTITRPAPVSNPIPISTLQPFPIRISRPFPIPIPQPIQIPIQRPTFVNVPQSIQAPFAQQLQVPFAQQLQVPFAQPLQVPFAQPVHVPFGQPSQFQLTQPHPTVFQQPIPFRISPSFAIPVPISAGITGHGGIIPGGNQGIYGGIGSTEGSPFGGIITGDTDENVIGSGALRANGGFAGSNNLNDENYGGYSFTRPDQGISQNYDNNGGYKY